MLSATGPGAVRLRPGSGASPRNPDRSASSAHLTRVEINLGRVLSQVVRFEESALPQVGHVALWIAAAHLPAWLNAAYRCERFAPGCYWVTPYRHDFLWVVANELPLRDELVAFLLARSGRALDEFARWVLERRPLEWLIDMLKYIPMSAPISEELLQRFGPEADPEVEARRQRILQALLRSSPQVRQQLIEEGQEQGQLLSARAHLRRVLERRKLRPSPAELARIEACSDLARLERWLDSAITAASVAEALADPPA